MYDSAVKEYVEQIAQLASNNGLLINKKAIDSLMCQFELFFGKLFNVALVEKYYKAASCKAKNYIENISEYSYEELFSTLLGDRQRSFIRVNNIFERQNIFFKKLFFDIAEIFSALAIDKCIHDIDLFSGDVHSFSKRTVRVKSAEKEDIYIKPYGCRNDKFFWTLVEKFFKSYLTYSPQKLYARVNSIDLMYGLPQRTNEVSDVEVLYYRFGMLMALGVLLSISDGHFDNFRIYDDTPIWFDLETMFDFQVMKSGGFSDVERTGMIQKRRKNKNHLVSVLQAPEVLNADTFYPSVVIEKDSILKIQYGGKGYLKNENYTGCVNDNVKRKKIGANIAEGFRFAISSIISQKKVFLDFLAEYLKEKELVFRVLPRSTIIYSHALALFSTPGQYEAESFSDDIRDLLIGLCDLEKNIGKKFLESELVELELGQIPYFYKEIEGKVFNAETGTKIVDTEANCIQMVNWKIDSYTKKKIEYECNRIQRLL